MTDKLVLEQVYRNRGIVPNRRLRGRLLDICEHLLVLVVFLVFLSFVQSLVATQQELDTNFTAQHGYHPVSLIEFGNSGVRDISAAHKPAGFKHARA